MNGTETALRRTGGHGRHAGQPIAHAGAALDSASAAMVLLHGRGADAAGMLDLAQSLAGPGVACFAPQAAGQVWYPRRFMEPVANNEPDLSSALSVLEDLTDELSARFTSARVALAGFSQGACLTLEFVRRRGRNWAAILGFSGGLIGASVGAATPGEGLAGVPALLGCSERDPYISAARVRESGGVLTAMGAAVTTLLYPGDSHTVTGEEIRVARRMLAGGAGFSSPAP